MYRYLTRGFENPPDPDPELQSLVNKIEQFKYEY